MIGKKVLNYRIDKLIGEGGMGNVYLGIHEQLDRKVAIKVLHDKLANNQELRERFKNEASALAHMQHPNIVALYDYVENEDGLFLIMEYVEGRELDVYINTDSGPIPKPDTISIMGQILDGFEYAHNQGIVHRDIKPSNILLTKDKKVKILDFGIAKLIEGDKSLTKTGTQMGTVLYMSPEQVQGEELDKRSDIYSLGVTLFQMITGQCPYNQNSTEFVVYNKIVNDPLPKANSIYPGVDDCIQSLIDKSTQKEKTSRYQSCSEFKKALLNSKECKSGDKTILKKPPLKAVIEKPISVGPEKKSNNKKVLFVLLPLLAIICVGIYFVNNSPSLCECWNMHDYERTEECETLKNEWNEKYNKASKEEQENMLAEGDACVDFSEFEDTAVKQVSSKPEVQEETLDNIDIDARDYDVKSEEEIVKGEMFTIKLNVFSDLSDNFVLNLKSKECSSFYPLSDSKYEGVINRDGLFEVEVYLKDKETSETRYVGNETFYAKKVLVNATPEMAVTEWVNNISSRKGFDMQTKWDDNGYFEGYGSTIATRVFYVDEISNDGSSAVVEVKYYSHDPNGKDYELVQRLYLNYLGASNGWKWHQKENYLTALER